MSQQETIALVSCVKSKVVGPCPAKDLYRSALFRYMRAYAEDHADRWFILSAKFGLVAPDVVMESYEQTLNGASISVRRAWADRVAGQMREQRILRPGVSFLWLAGQAYQKHLSQILVDYEQIDPLVGKRIGERLAWLKNHS